MPTKYDFRNDPAWKRICERDLLPAGTIEVPGTPSFSAENTFGASPPLIKRGALFNDTFIQVLLRKVEQEVPPATLVAYDLQEEKRSLDLVAMYLPMLGRKSELFLAYVWHLLTLQPAGEAGILLTNGSPNVFHVFGYGRSVLALSAHWSQINDWSIRADARLDAVNHQQVRWSAGCRVFSC